jgi:hypothetical protein
MKEQLDLLFFGKFPVLGLLQDYCMKSTIGEMLGFLRHVKSSKIREAGYLLLVPSWLSLAGYLLTLRVCDCSCSLTGFFF